MFDELGESDPRKMPGHLFIGALHLDYATAIRAEIGKQDFSVCPRHWYIDATFRCPRCDSNFVFTASEQQLWYETLGFWIDSRAKHCVQCRSELRDLKSLQQVYDRDIENSLLRDADHGCKRRMLEVIDKLTAGGLQLPGRMLEKQQILTKQLERDPA